MKGGNKESEVEREGTDPQSLSTLRMYPSHGPLVPIASFGYLRQVNVPKYERKESKSELSRFKKGRPSRWTADSTAFSSFLRLTLTTIAKMAISSVDLFAEVFMFTV